MKKYRWLTAALLAAMLGLSACRAALPEENASAAEIVEGSAQGTAEGGLPQKVENEGSGAQTPGGSTQQAGSTTQPGGQTQQPGSQTPQTGNSDLPDTSDESQNNQNQEETPVEKSYNLKLMAYNIRCANDPNGHSIDERAPRVKQIIAQNDPDVIGLEEVTPAWMTHLNADYQDRYSIIQYYRAAENREGLAILYKKEKYELVEEGFFWLSDTPDQESKGWDGDYYRICVWAKLKDKALGKTFVYYAVHLDGTDTCHLGSYRLIAREIEKNAKFPCFVGGDCNMRIGSAGYTAFLSSMDEARDLVSAPTSPSNTCTYAVGYPQIEAQKQDLNAIIDYIFHQENKAAAVDYQVDQTQVGGHWPSDHFPIICCYQI